MNCDGGGGGGEGEGCGASCTVSLSCASIAANIRGLPFKGVVAVLTLDDFRTDSGAVGT